MIAIKRIIKQNRLLFVIFFPIIFLRRFYIRLKAMPYNKFYDSTFDFVEEGSLRVRVPSFKGTFEIDFRSKILKRILRCKQYEPNLVEIVKKYVDPKKDIFRHWCQYRSFHDPFFKNCLEQ